MSKETDERSEMISRVRQLAAFVSNILDGDSPLKDTLIAAYGSLALAREFTDPKGVGIGRFSKLVGLPSSTVRHYIEQGLINPERVASRFVFNLGTLEEARRMKILRELGVPLEELTRKNNLRSQLINEASDDIDSMMNQLRSGANLSEVIMRDHPRAVEALRTFSEDAELDEVKLMLLNKRDEIDRRLQLIERLETRQR